MFDILLFIIFCTQNSKLARRKGLNPRPWVWRTIAAMFGGIFLGSIVISIGYRGGMNMASMQKFLFQNPLKLATVYVLEIGGGLLVRYMLDKKPDPTNQG